MLARYCHEVEEASFRLVEEERRSPFDGCSVEPRGCTEAVAHQGEDASGSPEPRILEGTCASPGNFRVQQNW